jgi:hypothetical protein
VTAKMEIPATTVTIASNQSAARELPSIRAKRQSELEVK